MSGIDPINSAKISPAEISCEKAEVAENTEALLFEGEEVDAAFDTAEISKGELSEEMIAKIKDGDLAESIISAGKKVVDPSKLHDIMNFDVAEAYVYAEGEDEIQKMINAEKMRQMSMVGIMLNHKDDETIEAECRAKYAEKHPEYADVMREGQNVERKYEAAKDDEMAEWMKNNPKPEMSGWQKFFGGIAFSAKHAIEVAKWQAEYDKHAEAFEEQYAEENPNYANLKTQQDRIEKEDRFKDIFLGGIAGVATGGITGGVAGGVAGAIVNKTIEE